VILPHYVLFNAATAAFKQGVITLGLHFILFLTCECAQKVKVFVTGKRFQLGLKQHSSLLGPFVSLKQ
jgi:hypothetical protein